MEYALPSVGGGWRRLVETQPGSDVDVAVTLLLIQFHEVPSFELKNFEEGTGGRAAGTTRRELVVAELSGLARLFFVELVFAGMVGLHVALEHG